jgi:hypothetical protein
LAVLLRKVLEGKRSCRNAVTAGSNPHHPGSRGPVYLRDFRRGKAILLAGLPQVSIPAGTVSGCPAGLSFIG